MIDTNNLARKKSSYVLLAILAGIVCSLFMYQSRFQNTYSKDIFRNNGGQHQSQFLIPRPLVRPFCDEECRWQKQQRHRQEVLQRACAAANETHPSTIKNMTNWLWKHKPMLSFLWVSDKHKALYCNVPKVASSNWKRVFYLMNNHNLDGPINQSFILNVSQDRHIHDHTARAPWRLAHMSSEDVIHRLKTYTSFIVVRKPYSRVLSAYREKFQGKQLLLLWRYWMYRIYIYLRYGIMRIGRRRQRNMWRQFRYSNSTLFMPYGYSLSYQDFVNFAIEPGVKYTYQGDQHWMPINELCHPCQMRYDIIAKLETMDTDSRFILKRFGVPELLDVVAATPSHETNSSAEDIQRTYYSTLSSKDIQGFQQRYERDFNYFEYDMNISRELGL